MGRPLELGSTDFEAKDVDVPERERSIVNLIAWLSVCLLAVAFGSTLGPAYRQIWSFFGAFGLSAAVGLESITRIRKLHQRRRQRAQAIWIQQQRLTRLDCHNRLSRTIQEAMRRIIEEARVRKLVCALPPEAAEIEQSDRRVETRTPCWLPVTLYTFQGDDSSDSNSCAEIPAFLRDVSPTGIGLCHREPVSSHEAVVQVEMSDGRRVALLAGERWSRKAKDGWYVSGWRLVGVLSENDASSDDLQPAEACAAS